MKYLLVILLPLLVLTSVECLPGKGSASKSGSGAIKSGIQAVFKSKSSSSGGSSYTTSSYGGSPLFAPTVGPFSSTSNYPKLFQTTTTQRTTRKPISEEEYYENIRRTYCHAGSKISLEEIKVAVTCPGSGFTLQLFSALTNDVNNATVIVANSNSTLENGTTTPSNTTDANTNSTSISSTTTPTEIHSISISTINSTTIGEPSTNSTLTITEQTNSTMPTLSNSEKVLKICDSFNSTCFENMQTFVNECLTLENSPSSSSPFSEAYQFDLFMAQEACVANKTTQIDEWTNGLEKCLSPYFTNQGETLRKTVSSCHKRLSGPILNLFSNSDKRSMNITHRYDNKIVGCVKDKITAPSCTMNCTWGTPGCTPLTTLTRNYYLESVISLQTLLDRSSFSKVTQM